MKSKFKCQNVVLESDLDKNKDKRKFNIKYILYKCKFCLVIFEFLKV